MKIEFEIKKEEEVNVRFIVCGDIWLLLMFVVQLLIDCFRYSLLDDCIMMW